MVKNARVGTQEPDAALQASYAVSPTYTRQSDLSSWQILDRHPLVHEYKVVRNTIEPKPKLKSKLLNRSTHGRNDISPKKANNMLKNPPLDQERHVYVTLSKHNIIQFDHNIL